jgi:hypothetical protein
VMQQRLNEQLMQKTLGQGRIECADMKPRASGYRPDAIEERPRTKKEIPSLRRSAVSCEVALKGAGFGGVALQVHERLPFLGLRCLDVSDNIP